MALVKTWPLITKYTKGYSVLGTVYGIFHRWKDPVRIKDGKYNLILPRKYAGVLWRERSLWEKWYGTDFTGQIVLDVGAGAGETASFFFNHGAKIVVAVECDPIVCNFLEQNRINNNWDLVVVRERFSLDHLNYPYHYLKMDIEGGEELLLAHRKPLGKARIELHTEFIGQQKVDAIIQKFNLKPIQKPYIWASSD